MDWGADWMEKKRPKSLDDFFRHLFLRKPRKILDSINKASWGKRVEKTKSTAEGEGRLTFGVSSLLFLFKVHLLL